MGRLSGKTAVITGAARGMGAAQAELFVDEGARVFLTDVDHGSVEQLAQRLGPQVAFAPHDVASEADWTRVETSCLGRLGGFDILVNNAGQYIAGGLLDTSLATFEQLVRVNQVGVFLGMRTAARSMRSRQVAGSIVNISSIAGLRGTVGMFAYASTKWATRGMSRAGACELATHRIRVNSVHPGLTSTAMLKEMPDAQVQQIASKIPLGRLGTPDEVARLVLFLASDEAVHITGAEVQIDGGSLA